MSKPIDRLHKVCQFSEETQIGGNLVAPTYICSHPRVQGMYGAEGDEECTDVDWRRCRFNPRNAKLYESEDKK